MECILSPELASAFSFVVIFKIKISAISGDGD
jgi:hypothetical protein